MITSTSGYVIYTYENYPYYYYGITTSSLTTSDISASFNDLSGVSASPLLNTDLVTLPTSFYSDPPTGTISPPSLSSTYTYPIGDTALDITIPSFTYSITDCTDIVWTYTCTQNDGSALPSIITFT